MVRFLEPKLTLVELTLPNLKFPSILNFLKKSFLNDPCCLPEYDTLLLLFSTETQKKHWHEKSEMVCFL